MFMIRDLSETLRRLLVQSGLEAEVVFDCPAEAFKPTQTTVDLFLYDVRENVELRNNEPIVERQNRQARIRRPPLRVACSYLITAWPGGVTGDELALQEHQLLGRVLQTLAQHPTIPDQVLPNNLKGQDPPWPMVILHPDASKNMSEFWTSLGNKLRPSLTVTVTINMDITATPEVTPLVQVSQTRLQEQTTPNAVEESFRISGRVLNTATPPQPIKNATVVLVETGLTATTDADGYYSLGSISAGTYSLRVEFNSIVTVRQGVAIPPSEGMDYNVQLDVQLDVQLEQ
jgi:hypothetical protein